MKQVIITYYGHACFCLEYAGWRIVLDPYADDSVPGMLPLRVKAERVYCSHGHSDHNFAEGVALQETCGEAPYSLQEILVPHDDQNGAKRGMSYIRVFDFDGIRVAHMGDLGRPLTDEETRALSDLDCMLLPVGGYFTIDASTAKQVVDATHPRVVIPMHYRTAVSGYPVIAELESYTSLLDSVNYGETSFCLTPDTPAQTIVLKNKNT